MVREHDHGPAIAVLQTEILHVRQEIARNREESASHAVAASESRAEMSRALADLKTDLNERKGAEKLANAIRMTLSGAVGAFVVKLLTYFSNIPIK